DCSAALRARTPRGVSSHPSRVGVRTLAPRARSSAAMRLDTVTWFSPRASAARTYRPVRTTCSRTSRSSALGLRLIMCTLLQTCSTQDCLDVTWPASQAGAQHHRGAHGRALLAEEDVEAC